MIERLRVLDILADMPGDAADQALLDGILLVEHEVQSEIAEIILDRERDHGCEGLIAVYDRLARHAQQQVLAHTSRLFGALRNTIRSSTSQTRQNTLAIVGRSGNPRLAYLAGQAMRDGSPSVRAEGAATILALTERHCANDAEIREALCEVVEREPGLFRIAACTMRLLRDEREYLLETLRDALKCYESHHRTEVLEAAMRLAHELEEGLFGGHAITRGKLVHAMSEILAEKLSPKFVPVVYLSLSHPELRRHVVPIVESSRDSKFFTEFIRWHWLCEAPAVRKHLGAINRLAWLDDGFQALFGLPADVATLAPRWLIALGLPNSQKISLLRDCMILDNPLAHRAAAWALAELSTPDSLAELEILTEHEDPAIRLIAERELQHHAFKHGRKRDIIAGNRPFAWQAMMGRAGIGESFAELWEKLEHIPRKFGEHAGHHAMRYVPGFYSHVQEKLHSPRSSDRLRVLQMLTMLGLEERFSRDLFAAGNDSSNDIRAAAVSALGRIGGETSRRILERALHDEEPAVQAAAIEAIEKLGLNIRDDLISPKLESDSAPVRAAAVRCLLRMQRPEAATTLMSMLHDIHAEHRIAALWLVDQLQLHALTDRITNMAQCDPDARIARLAIYVGRRLRRKATVENAAQTAEAAS